MYTARRPLPTLSTLHAVQLGRLVAFLGCRGRRREKRNEMGMTDSTRILQIKEEEEEEETPTTN